MTANHRPFIISSISSTAASKAASKLPVAVYIFLRKLRSSCLSSATSSCKWRTAESTAAFAAASIFRETLAIPSFEIFASFSVPSVTNFAVSACDCFATEYNFSTSALNSVRDDSSLALTDCLSESRSRSYCLTFVNQFTPPTMSRRRKADPSPVHCRQQLLVVALRRFQLCPKHGLRNRRGRSRLGSLQRGRLIFRAGRAPFRRCLLTGVPVHLSTPN